MPGSFLNELNNFCIYRHVCVLYTHNINNINNTGRLCWNKPVHIWYMNRFISFCLQSLATQETQFIKAYANHTMLVLPHTHMVHLVVSKIFADQSPKWSDLIRSDQTSTPPFQNPKILMPYLPGMTSSTYSIHSNCASSPISCLRVYYDRWWLSYPFHTGMQTHCLTVTPEARDTK